MRLTGIIRDRGCLTEVSNISFHSNRAQYYDAKFGIRRNVFTTFIQMYSALVVLVFFLFFLHFGWSQRRNPYVPYSSGR